MVTEQGDLRFHRIQNVQKCLDQLKTDRIKLVNIQAEDIVDGNHRLTLGLVWAMILHYQVKRDQESESLANVKAELLKWAQRMTKPYESVQIQDFRTSWRDGYAFSALIHRKKYSINFWLGVENLSSRCNEHCKITLKEKCYKV